jgi:hypothetical protein
MTLQARNYRALRASERELIPDLDRETLKKTPGFDRRHWPALADPVLGRQTHKHHGRTP